MLIVARYRTVMFAATPSRKRPCFVIGQSILMQSEASDYCINRPLLMLEREFGPIQAWRKSPRVVVGRRKRTIRSAVEALDPSRDLQTPPKF